MTRSPYEAKVLAEEQKRLALVFRHQPVGGLIANSSMARPEPAAATPDRCLSGAFTATNIRAALAKQHEPTGFEVKFKVLHTARPDGDPMLGFIFIFLS